MTYQTTDIKSALTERHYHLMLQQFYKNPATTHYIIYLGTYSEHYISFVTYEWDQ